jgi:hypothetical protein
MSEHDPNKVEKEMGNDMLEHDKQRKIDRAIANIVAEISNLDDAGRREVLNKALKQMDSPLRVRKG